MIDVQYFITYIISYWFEQNVNTGHDSGLEWPLALAEYIRNNDQSLLECGTKLLHFYEEDLLPCQSFGEFCDVLDLLNDIHEPDNYLVDAIKSTN